MLLKRELASQSSFSQIIGQSEPMQRVYDIIKKVADSKSNVLSRGGERNGKGIGGSCHPLQQRALVHALCDRQLQRRPRNIAGERVVRPHEGVVHRSHFQQSRALRGRQRRTIFLDEIGDTTLPIQVKLLRVIQEREFRRVGGTQDMKVDVRIIAATNRDLEKAVAEGSFREDLYYRLDVIPIKLPPLRMRTSDIPLLTQHFLEKFAKESGKPVPTMNQEAMRVLLAHEWRGNVRELENVIERVVAFTTGSSVTEADIRGWLHKSVSTQQVLPSDLPEDGLDLERLIDSIEKDLLLKALERSQWVKKRAARLLRLNTRSFRYRLEKYEIKGGRD